MTRYRVRVLTGAGRSASSSRSIAAIRLNVTHLVRWLSSVDRIIDPSTTWRQNRSRGDTLRCSASALSVAADAPYFLNIVSDRQPANCLMFSSETFAIFIWCAQVCRNRCGCTRTGKAAFRVRRSTTSLIPHRVIGPAWPIQR